MVQAVRSFLHFSQLSAWLNKSNGTKPSPSQLLYRVTMPGQAFASKFASSQPLEHHFPVAHVGRLRTHVIKVSVSSLPRTDAIPHIHCGKCRFVKYSRNEEEEDGKPPPPQQHQQGRAVDSCDGLLDLPPAQQLRLQQRLHRSRSRSGSPSIDSVRFLQRSRQPIRARDMLDYRMRMDCNRLGKRDWHCNDQEGKSGKERQWQQSEEIQMEIKLPAADHGDRWGNDLERGRRLDPSGGTETGSTERGRSRRSRKDCFRMNEVNSQKSELPPTSPTPDPAVGPAVIVQQTGKSVPTSDDKLRFQRSLNSAATLLFHTTASTGHHNGLTKAPFPLKFLRSPPLRMSSSPLLGSFEVSWDRLILPAFPSSLTFDCLAGRNVC